MNETVECEHCHKVSPITVKTRQHGHGIEEVYILCPHCQAEHIAYVTDAQARREQEEIRKLHDRYIKRKGKLSVHMEQLKADILNKREASV